MSLRAPALPKSPIALSAREKLLDAAAIVFARDGLSAATTREIAQVAGVNEVTLFRLFQTKQNLMAMVLERVFASAPNDASAESSEASLSEILRGYADRYLARLKKNLALMRVLLGEIQHFQEHEMKVIRAIFRPERQKLIENLAAAQEHGVMRRDADPVIVADQFGAMLFMGALKESMPTPLEYPPTRYVEASVELIVRAIESSPAAPTSRSSKGPAPKNR